MLTPYVFATERPRRLSPEEKETLDRFLEPEERGGRGSSRPRPGTRRSATTRVHVRFSDVDVYGHVNNVKYFEYFQEARILMMARLWSDVPDGPPDRPSFVVAQTDVDYQLPILFRPEPYDAWSWISHVGERSLVIESEICDGDTVLSRARVVLVFFDPRHPAGARPRRSRAV